MELKNLVGERYGRLVVVSEASRSGLNNYRRNWNCICDCGNTKSIVQTSLRRGLTKSCGCLHIEFIKQNKITHGSSGLTGNRNEYRCWSGIKTRCYNKKDKRFHNYGGRGIIMCDRWVNSFENFLSDMGQKPSKLHSIERIDVNGIYEPNNCKWATVYEQSRNRTTNHWLEYKGVKKIILDWSLELGVSESSIRSHLDKGRSFEYIYEYLTEKKKNIS